MNIAEVQTLIAEVEGTLAALHEGMRAVMAALRAEPLEVEVEVSHAGKSRLARKPHPALRRAREIRASIRAFNQHLRELRTAEKELTMKQKLDTGRWSQFVDAAEQRRKQNGP